MTISRRDFTFGAAGALGAAATLDGAWSLRSAIAAQESSGAPGTLKWKFQTGDWHRKHRPDFAGDTVVVGQGRFVIAFDPATGDYRWQFETTSNEVVYTVVDGVVYLGDWDENVIALDAETGEELWRFATDDVVYTAPTIVDATVYVVGGGFYALDAETGTERWRFDTMLFADTSPAVGNGLVFLVSGDTNVYALEADTGAERWRFATEGQLGALVFVNGTLFVGNDYVYALNAATGTQLWQFGDSDTFWSQPAVSEGTVYAGCSDDHVYALDATSGSELWRFATQSYITATPLLVDEMLYVHSHDANLYALDAGTGAELWRFTTEFSDPPALWVKDGVVYFHRNYVVALDRETGAELWRSGVGSADSASVTSVDGVVYQPASGNRVYALDGETGVERWRFSTGVVITSAEVVAGTVYASGDGILHAVDAETGAYLWQLDLDGVDGEPTPPVVDDGAVYVSSRDRVHAVDAASGSERWSLPVGDLVQHAVDDVLLIQGISVDSSVYAVDVATGEERWRWRSEDGVATVAVADGTAFASSGYDNVVAIDVGTGNEKWHFATGSYPRLIVANGAVYVLSEDGVDALDAETGFPSWRVSMEGGTSMPVATNDTILIRVDEEYGESLYGLDSASGTQRWSFSVDAEYIEGLTVVSGTAYLGAYHGDTTTTLYGLDARTGVEHWRLFSESGSPEELEVVDGTMYVSFGSYSRLHALAAETGVERWQFELDESISSPLEASDGILYFGCGDLNVYAVVAEPTQYPSLASGSAAVTLVDTPVRAAPLPTGNVVTTLPAGTELFISDVSEVSGGITWWPVITPDGTEGWVDGLMLRGQL